MADNNSSAQDAFHKNHQPPKKIILFPHGSRWFQLKDWPHKNFFQTLSEERYNAESFIRLERDQHASSSVERLVLSCWIRQWEAVDLDSFTNETLAVWCLLNSDQPDDVQLEKVKVLIQRGEIHIAVGILLKLRLVKEAIKVYLIEGYLFDAMLLFELNFSNSDDSQRVPMGNIDIFLSQENTPAPQQQAKLGLSLDTDLLLTGACRTLTPIAKDGKNSWVPGALGIVEED